MRKLRELESRINYRFKNVDLLVQALTHTTYANHNRVAHNQVLELLGDSVMELIVTDRLIQIHPTEREGALSNRRSGLVCEASLYSYARRLNIAPLLRVSADHEELREVRSVLADAVEALVGAAYRDGGFEAGRSTTLAITGL